MHKKALNIFLVWLTVFSVNTLIAQSNDPFGYIEKCNQRIDSIRNYAASFTVKSDISTLKMPVVQGKMFFKWPAHYSVSTYRFTVLPQRKLAPIVRFLKREDFKALSRGTEAVNGTDCVVIQLTPLDTLSKIENFVIWVDTTAGLVYRVLIKEKDESKFIYQYTYAEDGDILPSGLSYTFEYRQQQAQKVSLNPFALFGNWEEPKKIKGKITMDFHYTEIRREGDKAR
jgi:hypothetical protein